MKRRVDIDERGLLKEFELDEDVFSSLSMDNNSHSEEGTANRQLFVVFSTLSRVSFNLFHLIFCYLF
jgi:hypothetical protein